MRGLSLKRERSVEVGAEHTGLLTAAKDLRLINDPPFILIKTVGMTAWTDGSLAGHDRLATFANLVGLRVVLDLHRPLGPLLD